MSSSGSDVFDGDEDFCANYQFVELISKYPVVLNKSQIPDIKKQ